MTLLRSTGGRDNAVFLRDLAKETRKTDPLPRGGRSRRPCPVVMVDATEAMAEVARAIHGFESQSESGFGIGEGGHLITVGVDEQGQLHQGSVFMGGHPSGSSYAKKDQGAEAAKRQWRQLLHATGVVIFSTARQLGGQGVPSRDLMEKVFAKADSSYAMGEYCARFDEGGFTFRGVLQPLVLGCCLTGSRIRRADGTFEQGHHVFAMKSKATLHPTGSWERSGFRARGYRQGLDGGEGARFCGPRVGVRVDSRDGLPAGKPPAERGEGPPGVGEAVASDVGLCPSLTSVFSV